MSVKFKYLGISVTFLCFLAVFLFFGIAYGAHICYQEQYQLFEWTWKYFADTTGIPGGFADWTGRFLTQFFFNKWIGAAVIALSLVAAQLACMSSVTRKTPVTYVCSFLPALFLLLYYLDSTALVGGAVSIILPLLCAAVVRQAEPSRIRTVLSMVLVPVMYFLAGPAAIVYAAALPKEESVITRVAALLLCLAMPFAAAPFCHYPLKSLLTGIHYSRIPQNVPVFLWHSAFAAVILILASSMDMKELPRKKSLSVSLVLAVLLAAGSVLLVDRHSDSVGEEMMKYDRLVYLEDWDGIINQASVKMPDKPLSVSALNLALARKDLLGDWQFNYFQSGEAGLFPPYSISYFNLLPTSEIYWHLGMVGACQQYTFESQEAIPDFQKSARCYKRLAETYIVNGDYDVARKYLRALDNTLHYRSWARGILEMLEDENAVESEYGPVRERRVMDPDILFNESNKAAMLKLLIDRNPGNRLAQDYLISMMLLAKDLDGLESQILASGRDPLPKFWQEAVIMQWVTKGRSLDTLPDAVGQDNISRMNDFIGAMRSNRNETYMKNHFGNTYWYYCIYE